MKRKFITNYSTRTVFKTLFTLNIFFLFRRKIHPQEKWKGKTYHITVLNSHIFFCILCKTVNVSFVKIKYNCNIFFACICVCLSMWIQKEAKTDNDKNHITNYTMFCYVFKTVTFFFVVSFIQNSHIPSVIAKKKKN